MKTKRILLILSILFYLFSIIIIEAYLLFDLTNSGDTELENKQIKESKFDKLSKKIAQKGKKTELWDSIK